MTGLIFALNAVFEQQGYGSRKAKFKNRTRCDI